MKVVVLKLVKPLVTLTVLQDVMENVVVIVLQIARVNV